jgi:2-polyprenyl-6-methoxyphenol hydroxylase-like FAD-dependent oxidoreductase
MVTIAGTMGSEHVLIIGAGITGLSIAHGLEKAGIPYTIFESEEFGQSRPKEWTMGIHWSLPLLEGLLPKHLASRIRTDASVDAALDYDEHPNNGAYIFDGVSGKVLKDLAVTSGRLVRVSRRKLRALCAEGIDIKYGHRLESIKCDESARTVTATFSNSQKYTGTLLVGCDGPRSVVRGHLFASEPSDATAQAMEGFVNVSTCVSYSDPEIAKFVRSKSHPVWCMAISPTIFHFMSLQDVPDSEKPETWKFFHYFSWLGEKPTETSSADVHRALKERGEKISEVGLFVYKLDHY